MKYTRTFSAILISAVVLISSVAFTACGERRESSSSSSELDEYSLPKTEMIDITDELELSQFQDYDLSMSAPEMTHLFEQYYLYDNICITPNKDSYDITSDLKLEYVLHNNTDREIDGDDFFQLEVLIDGKWYAIEPLGYAFTDLAYNFRVGERELVCDLSRIYNVNFIDGRYRFIKTYSMSEYMQEAKYVVTYFEFDLNSE